MAASTILPLASAIVVAVLAAVHLVGDRLRFLDAVPRSRWLSFAGGVSVAYVFVHILPELAEWQEHLGSVLQSAPLDAHEVVAYVFALIGLASFYGLQRFVETRRKGARHEAAPHSGAVFGLHVGSFALYNVLVGYLTLHREQPGLLSLALFGVAMALHFLVNDRGLAAEHGHAYRRSGRWILAGAAVAGWLLGLLGGVPPTVLAILFALLGGATILNVLKEELPEHRRSRFGPFAAGATSYSVLLLLI